MGEGNGGSKDMKNVDNKDVGGGGIKTENHDDDCGTVTMRMTMAMNGERG